MAQHDFHEILPLNLNIDFVGRRRGWAIFSLFGVLASVVLFIVVGPNWGIDFTGGTEVQVHFDQTTEVAEVRSALESTGVGEDAIQSVQSAVGSTFLVRVQGQSGTKKEVIEATQAALVSAFGPDWLDKENGFTLDSEVGTRAKILYRGDPVSIDKVVAAMASVPNVAVQSSPEDNTYYLRLPGMAEDIRGQLETELKDRGVHIEKIDSIGPKVGESLKTSGLISLLVTQFLVMGYIWLRFDFSFAPGAILCMFHDSAMVIGLWILTRMEFGLPMISAILTLVGYSINDTVVTYDRIRENQHKYRRKNLPELINDSINQTLSRTLITTGATALALIPFLFFGGEVLRQFSIAMLFGMVVGTYSTIYVASPVMILLEDNKDMLLGLVGLKSKKSA